MNEWYYISNVYKRIKVAWEPRSVILHSKSRYMTCSVHPLQYINHEANVSAFQWQSKIYLRIYVGGLSWPFLCSVEISSLHPALLRYHHKITVHLCEKLRDLHWTLHKTMDVDEKHLSKSGHCFSWGFFEQKGFLCLGDFFPTEINCRYVFNSLILVFVCLVKSNLSLYKQQNLYFCSFNNVV